MDAGTHPASGSGMTRTTLLVFLAERRAPPAPAASVVAVTAMSWPAGGRGRALPDPPCASASHLCIDDEVLCASAEQLCIDDEVLCASAEQVCTGAEQLCSDDEVLCISAEQVCTSAE